jgi:hypothetical protein
VGVVSLPSAFTERGKFFKQLIIRREEVANNKNFSSKLKKDLVGKKKGLTLHSQSKKGLKKSPEVLLKKYRKIGATLGLEVHNLVTYKKGHAGG